MARIRLTDGGPGGPFALEVDGFELPDVVGYTLERADPDALATLVVRVRVSELDVALERGRVELRTGTGAPRAPGERPVALHLDDVECADDCPMCSGEVCRKCGAGSWAGVTRGDCEHDVLERHDPPEPPALVRDR